MQLNYNTIRKIKHKIINNKIGRNLDLFIRIIISKLIIIRSLFFFKKNHIDTSNFIFFLYGGIGDCLMQLPSIIKLSSYSEVIVIMPKVFNNIFNFNFENLKIIYYNKNYDLSSIKHQTKIYCNSKSVGILFSPVFENYILYRYLNINRFHGFIGSYNNYKSININFKNISELKSSNKKINYETIISDVIRNIFDSNYEYANNNLSFSGLLNENFPIQQIRNNYIIVNVNKTDTWPAGRWTILNYVTLIEKLSNIYNFDIILTGTENEKEYVDNLFSLISNTEKVFNLCGSTSLLNVFTLVKNANFVITCDAGIMHISSILNVLCFSIFSFSDPMVFAWGSKNIPIFSKIYNCMPCVGVNKLPLDNYPVLCNYNSRCDNVIAVNEVIMIISQNYKINQIK